jgi:hypothetical protein
LLLLLLLELELLELEEEEEAGHALGEEKEEVGTTLTVEVAALPVGRRYLDDLLLKDTFLPPAPRPLLPVETAVLEEL